MGRFAKPTLLGRCRGRTGSRPVEQRGLRAHQRPLARVVRPGHGHRRSRRDRLREPARMDMRRSRRSSRAAASRCRSIRRSRRRRPATSWRTPGRGSPIVSTKLQLEKIQEVRHQLPALEASCVMDGGGRSDQPFGHVVRRRRRARPRAHDVAVGRRPRVPRTRARGQAGAARDDHLHLGHDRASRRASC